MRLAWLLIPVLATACGGGGGVAADADPSAPDGGGPGSPDGGGAVGTPMHLMTATYQIPDGDEYYQCTRITADRDLFITRITPISGEGTHHTILAIDPSPIGPGDTTCGPIETDWVVLFASGVGSPHLDMPPGVALPIRAGEEIVFNLHLFNAGDTQIDDESSLEVLVIDEADVQDEAEVILAGPIQFNIPPGSGQMVYGSCTMTGATNFFAVFPHMHQLGTHIKVTAQTDADDVVVYDEDYTFEDQTFATWEPIAMSQGDRINVECTYDNDTGGTVSFGDSSLEEMCFAISYRYPALGTNPISGAICPL